MIVNVALSKFLNVKHALLVKAFILVSQVIPQIFVWCQMFWEKHHAVRIGFLFSLRLFCLCFTMLLLFLFLLKWICCIFNCPFFECCPNLISLPNILSRVELPVKGGSGVESRPGLWPGGVRLSFLFLREREDIEREERETIERRKKERERERGHDASTLISSITSALYLLVRRCRQDFLAPFAFVVPFTLSKK